MTSTAPVPPPVRYLSPPLGSRDGGAMLERTGSVLHQQALTVMGFFTGLTLTALVLILTSPADFDKPIGFLTGPQYFETISTYVAIVGSVSCVCLIGFLEMAGGMASLYSFVDKFATTAFFVSVFGFMGILPLLLAPFSTWGAIVVLVAEVVLLVTYFVGRVMWPRGPERPAEPSH